MIELLAIAGLGLLLVSRTKQDAAASTATEPPAMTPPLPPPGSQDKVIDTGLAVISKVPLGNVLIAALPATQVTASALNQFGDWVGNGMGSGEISANDSLWNWMRAHPTGSYMPISFSSDTMVGVRTFFMPTGAAVGQAQYTGGTYTDLPREQVQADYPDWYAQKVAEAAFQALQTPVGVSLGLGTPNATVEESLGLGTGEALQYSVVSA